MKKALVLAASLVVMLATQALAGNDSYNYDKAGIYVGYGNGNRWSVVARSGEQFPFPSAYYFGWVGAKPISSWTWNKNMSSDEIRLGAGIGKLRLGNFHIVPIVGYYEAWKSTPAPNPTFEETNFVFFGVHMDYQNVAVSVSATPDGHVMCSVGIRIRREK